MLCMVVYSLEPTNLTMVMRLSQLWSQTQSQTEVFIGLSAKMLSALIWGINNLSVFTRAIFQLLQYPSDFPKFCAKTIWICSKWESLLWDVFMLMQKLQLRWQAMFNHCITSMGQILYGGNCMGRMYSRESWLWQWCYCCTSQFFSS